MPAKNRVKIFGENRFYHVYNRGFNRQPVFHDDQDFRTFLYLLKKYLEPGFLEKRYTEKGEEYFVEPNHVYNEIELIAYCLMSNHFHLLLYQTTREGMTKLLRRVATSYSIFYNQKYQQEGSPFQDIYKAVAIKTEEQLLHLSRYIHINPISIEDNAARDLSGYPYSSYSFYLTERRPVWLKPEKILNSFKTAQDYKNFVEDFLKAGAETKNKETEIIKDLLLE